MKYLLKFMSSRPKYLKYMDYIKETTVPQETWVLLKGFGEYFETRPELQELDFDGFEVWFNMIKFPVLKQDKRELFKKLIEETRDCEVPEEDRNRIISKFLEQDYAAQIQDISNRVLEGEHGADLSDVERLVLEYQHQSSKVAQKASYELEWDINEIMDSVDGKGSLRWRLDCFNKSYGPIGKGDFIVLAGRPDSGKTTLTLSEFTYMASQLPGEQIAVWVNNEERGEKVQSRMLQATLGWTKQQIDSNRTKAFDEYIRIQGFKNRIKLLDDKSGKLTMKEIEHYLRDHDIGLLVIDQLWKVPTPNKDISDVGTQTYLSNYARHLAKEYCPVFGVYQLDGTAEGVKYPTMNQLYFSKTAVQGEADLILMNGRSYEFGLDSSRFIHAPKHKLSSPEQDNMRGAQHELIIKPEICRFVEQENFDE